MLSRFLTLDSSSLNFWSAVRLIPCCVMVAAFVGCHASQTTRSPQPSSSQAGQDFRSVQMQQVGYSEPAVELASHQQQSFAPLRVRDIDSAEPWPMLWDEVILIALDSSPLIRDAGGRVLSLPDSVRSSADPAILMSDPLMGPEAALSAFDAQVEAGLTWNGGGRSVNSTFSSGTFGQFSQPRTIAKLGVGRIFRSGTQLTVGGIGGYDNQIASGFYAAYGAELRHPLMRGAGSEVNAIAGPGAQAGLYRGVLIAQTNEDRSHLELEQAVRDLVRDVARAYWELFFAYENLRTKRKAREQARQSWEREKLQVAAQVAPRDSEALARQQFYSADAAVQNAISGTATSTGVYAMETKLRELIGLPICDGRLIHPATRPLQAEFRFDWEHTLEVAHQQRVEIRKQLTALQKTELELRAAHNLARPQVDVVGQYRRLADDPGDGNALFSEALQGWQLGIEVQRPIANRREFAAVRNAELRLRREQVLLNEQERAVSAQLRMAFTELDRAYGVMQTQKLSHEAAVAGLEAETARHAAGEIHISRVLESQLRATQAATAYQRALVDYNLAFVNLNFVGGTLLETLGVGFAADTPAEEVRFSQNTPSVFSHENNAPHIVAERPVQNWPR